MFGLSRGRRDPADRSSTVGETPEQTIARLNRATGVKNEPPHKTMSGLNRAAALSTPAVHEKEITSRPNSRRGGRLLPDSAPHTHPGFGDSFRLNSSDVGQASARAWAALQAGNQRWASGDVHQPRRSPDRRQQVAGVQAPWAVVLGCVDSRVPVELIFDVGLGDLMVVRTAGQAVNELVIASADFAPRAFGTPLIVVLGHQRCAAVQLTIDAIQHRGGQAPGQDHAIVRALHPAYDEALRQRRPNSHEQLEDLVAAQQTILAAHRLRTEPALAAKVAKRELTVVAAHYNLDSGLVAVLD